MNLEDRLRAELERSGRSTNVGVAPSIDELALVANDRRHRNRVLGASGAVLLSSSLLFGAFYASQPNGQTTVEVADAAPNSDAAAQSEATEVLDDDVASSDMAAVDAEDATDDAAADIEETVDAASDAPVEESWVDADEAGTVDADTTTTADFGSATLLQNDNATMTVETRESAVGLSSGSGVLVLADGAGGYVGLAAAFGDSTMAMALASENGLDWTSTELVGVPEDATASILREHDGTYVALFERFDASAGVKRVLIGTSSDMVTWDVSAPLAGSEVYATDLAVGSPGVIVIGDDQSPQVWSGPIGGPYERTGRLDALSLSGATTVGDAFVVAGRTSDLGVALFRSTDAADWDVQALASAGVDVANHTVSVADGAVILRNIDDAAAGTLVSNDGGITWTALSAASNRGVSVSASTMGFLGEDGSSSVVAIADEDSFSTAQIDVAAPDRLRLVATGSSEIVMVQTSESGTTWIVASR